MNFYFFSLLYISIIDFSFILYFKKKFTSVLFLTLVYGSFIMMIFGLVNQLRLGLYISFASSTCYIIYKIIKDKNEVKNLFIHNFVSVGLIIYILLFVFLVFLEKGNSLSYYDEFNLWGSRVAQMLNYNSIRNINAKFLYPNSIYPMFLGCLESMFCIFYGAFEDSVCYIATSFFYFSLFGLFFECLEINKIADWLKALALSICILLLGTSITTYEAKSIYDSIYADYFLGSIIAFCFYNAYKYDFDNNKYNFVLLIFSLLTLVFTKQTGIGFALLVLLYLLIKYNTMKNKISSKKTLLRKITIPLIILLILAIDFNFTNIIFNESIKTYLSFVFDKTQWQHNIMTKLINTVFTSRTTPGFVSLPSFWYSLILTTLLFVINYINTHSLKESLKLPCISFLGYILFVIGLMFFYFFLADKEIYPDNIILPSYGRYLGSYIYSQLLLLFYVVYDTYKKSYIPLIFPFLCLLTTDTNRVKKELYIPYVYTTDRGIYEKSILDMCEKIKNIDPGNSLLVVEQWEEKFMERIYIDDFFAAKHDYTITHIQLGTEIHSAYDPSDLSLSEYINLLGNYNYLYLVFPDDYFIDNYWSKTTNAPIYIGAIYKINNIENNNIDLELYIY